MRICIILHVSGVKLMNSPFWTSHFYKCENVKLLNLRITFTLTARKSTQYGCDRFGCMYKCTGQKLLYVGE